VGESAQLLLAIGYVRFFAWNGKALATARNCNTLIVKNALRVSFVDSAATKCFP
jgi:hypothetical protein